MKTKQVLFIFAISVLSISFFSYDDEKDDGGEKQNDSFIPLS